MKVNQARPIVLADPVPAPPALVSRARRLAQVGLAWHAVEASVAIAAGAAAGSVALVGFGADSLIELLAGLILLWRFAAARAQSHTAEHRARRLIGASFLLVALYVATDAIAHLALARHPQASPLGIGLAAVAALSMPPLALAKQRNATRLRSPAATGESRQTMLCAYLAVGLLVGLVANAMLGWWWADPVTALGIAVVAAREGVGAWRGEPACCGGV